MGQHGEVDDDVDEGGFRGARGTLLDEWDKRSIGQQNRGHVNDPRIECTGPILLLPILLAEDEEAQCVQDQYGDEDLDHVEHPIFVDGNGDVDVLPEADVEELADPPASLS